MKNHLILFLLLIAACSDTKYKPIVDQSAITSKMPVQESWDTKIIFSEEGKLKAILHTNHLQMFDDSKETLLDGVKLDFYDDKKNISSTLTSKRGRVDDNTNDMYAIDSVVAVNDSGVVLTTDELIWNNKTQKMKSDKFVRIINKDELIEGYGMESNQDLTNYKIFNITYVTSIKEENK